MSRRQTVPKALEQRPPSSQTSPISMAPLPHLAQGAPALGQTQPVSSLQSKLQPSPLRLLPSSQISLAAAWTTPSPQRSTGLARGGAPEVGLDRGAVGVAAVAARVVVVVAGFDLLHDSVAAESAGMPGHRTGPTGLDGAGRAAAVATRRRPVAVVALLAALLDAVAALLAGCPGDHAAESGLVRVAIGGAAVAARAVAVVAGLAGLEHAVAALQTRLARGRTGEPVPGLDLPAVGAASVGADPVSVVAGFAGLEPAVAADRADGSPARVVVQVAPASRWQLAPQPSPAATLPSSQPSFGSTRPLPQRAQA